MYYYSWTGMQYEELNVETEDFIVVTVDVCIAKFTKEDDGEFVSGIRYPASFCFDKRQDWLWEGITLENAYDRIYDHPEWYWHSGDCMEEELEYRFQSEHIFLIEEDEVRR